jgi:hypothetical protein
MKKLCILTLMALATTFVVACSQDTGQQMSDADRICLNRMEAGLSCTGTGTTGSGTTTTQTVTVTDSGT